MPRALILCVALLTGSAVHAAAWPPANQALLHSARLWEARERGDLAKLALQKLVASRPDSPEALLELGELDLRLGDFADAASVAEHLQSRFRGSAAQRSFSVEYRVATREHLQLVSIGRLIELGRTAQARETLDRLFADGPPRDGLGIEYYDLLARLPNGWAQGFAGLSRLAREHPDDPRYQLALVRHLLRQSRHAGQALAVLERLARDDDVRMTEVDPLLAVAIQELGYRHADDRLVRDYLVRHPDDSAIARIRLQQQRAREDQRLLSRDNLAAAVADIQQRLSRDLKRELAQSPGGPAVRAAERWLTLSLNSNRERHTRQAATELRAALAFERRLYEAEIAVARDLNGEGAVEEAGDLLQEAATLAPRSVWLFETRARWLIEHGQPGAALALLRQRAPTGKWTREARDELLASALDRRAAAEEQAGDADAAMVDLEAALAVAPRAPWIRYRLATLYRVRREYDRGRALMSDGVRVAPDDAAMRYAQALYLADLQDYPAALAAIEGVDEAARSEDMNELHDRLRVTLACATAVQLKSSGDMAGARSALLAVEPIAIKDFDRAAELAYAWIALGFAQHGIEFLEPAVAAAGPDDRHALLTWAQVLNSALDVKRLAGVLDRLRTMPGWDASGRAEIVQLQRALDVRIIRSLLHERRYAEANRRLEGLLAKDPHDRALRVLHAELYLASGQPRLARDAYASLTAEQPDDFETRLAYVRALTESGDLGLAREQLQAIEERMPADDDELRIDLARRQLDLGDPRAALRSLEELLARTDPRADVLLLEGRAELALRHFARARNAFARAEQTASGDDLFTARREREAIDSRLDPVVTAGLVVRDQPGEAGMSRLEMTTIPSVWRIPLDYEQRLTARADAVTIDAGTAGSDTAPLLGTVQAAGPSALRHAATTRQSGMSLGLGYQTDTITADLGTTPLGFVRTNIVGGVEWMPKWAAADVYLGLARRALTNSELSYAGLRDPITGTAWGAVVQSGPYAGIGVYREKYGLSAGIQFDELSGTHVPNNQFAGLHLGADWKFIAQPDLSLSAGGTLNVWNYQRNLSNYTFGNGGYYSPQSYVSAALPVELNGRRAGWIYRLRLSVSYSIADSERTAFYPNDPTLQVDALHSPLPAGYSSAYFPDTRSNAIGFSAAAMTERAISPGLVIGAALETDRTDYYHPTTVSLYFRHVFGAEPTPTIAPIRPLRPYSP